MSTLWTLLISKRDLKRENDMRDIKNIAMDLKLKYRITGMIRRRRIVNLNKLR
jgi:hypothetical protein